jgi:hypothetical protein
MSTKPPKLPDWFVKDGEQYGEQAPPNNGEVVQPRTGSPATYLERVTARNAKKDESIFSALPATLARGVAGGVNEITRSANYVAKGVGALFDSTPGSVAKWWESPDKVDGVFTEEDISNAFGTNRGGGLSFIEGITSFAVGLVGFSKVVKPLQALTGTRAAVVGAQAAGTAVKGVARAAKLGDAVLAAGAADAFTVDPDAARVSDVALRASASQGPRWLNNAVTRYLASDPNDSQAERRMKNALEGFVSGAVIDGVTSGVKALYRARHGASGAAAGAGKGAGPQTATEALTGQAADKATESVRVIETTTGFEIHFTDPAKPDGANAAADAVLDGAEREGKQGLEGLSFTNREQAENMAATINLVSKDAAKPPTYLDAESLRLVMESATRFGKETTADDIKKIFDETSLNVNYYDRPEDGLRFIEATADVFAQQFEKGAVRADDELFAHAEKLFPGENGADVVAGIRAKYGDVKNIDAFMLAHRTYIAGLEQHTRKMAAIMTANPDNSVAMEAMIKTLDTLLGAEIGVTRIASELGRGLRQMQLKPEAGAVDRLFFGLSEAGRKASDTPASIAGEKAVLEEAASTATPFTDLVNNGNWTKEEVMGFMRQIFYASDEQGVRESLLNAIDLHSKAAREAGPKAPLTRLQKFNNFRTSMLLYSPKTHIANVLSNSFIAIQKPAETYWAGVRTGNKELRGEAWDTMVGLGLNFRESLRLAGIALQQGTGALDNVRGVDGVEIAAEGLNRPGFGTRLLNTPGQLLVAEDEFFKQINYRSVQRSDVLRQARLEGITDPAEVSRRIGEAYKLGVSEGGSAVNAKAMKYAQEATLQEPLQPGTLAHSLNALANGNAAVRFVLPFIKVPTNILRFLGDRTPGLTQFVSQSYKEAIEAGGERAAIATAKMEMGGMLWTTGFMLAMDGAITGRGPKDPDLRSMLESTGWKPYSFRVPTADGYRYVLYRRAEPSLAPFALTADMVQMFGEMDEQDAGGLVSATMAGVASAVFSKSYLQGMVDALDAIASGEQKKMSRFFANSVASLVPSGLPLLNPSETVQDVRPENPGGFFADVEQAINLVQSRIPGFSDGLESRRNLFGEKMLQPPAMYGANRVNPFTISREQVDGDVMEELIRISEDRAGINLPNPMLEGLSLRDRSNPAIVNAKGQSAYDRWLELHGGDASKGLPPLRQQLASLVNSPAWKNIPEGDDQYAPGGTKFQLAAEIIMQQRTNAQDIMLSEFPELNKQIEVRRLAKANAQYLDNKGVQDILDFAK